MNGRWFIAWVGLVIATIVLVIAYGMIYQFNWLDRHDWVATLALTLALLTTTFAYVVDTNLLVGETQKQVRATQQLLELEYTPNIVEDWS